MNSETYEFHGLVHVDSEATGKQALHKLKGSLIKDVQVTFREYVLRDWHNDRRETLSPVQFNPPRKHPTPPRLSIAPLQQN